MATTTTETPKNPTEIFAPLKPGVVIPTPPPQPKR
jgi:hypothetical protein